MPGSISGVGWKCPWIWIAPQFPPFLKNKVFVVYIIPAGLTTKEAVSGKEITPQPIKYIDKVSRGHLLLLIWKEGGTFSRYHVWKRCVSTSGDTQFVENYLGESVTKAQKFNYCSYVKPLQLHSLCCKATNPKIRHLYPSSLFQSFGHCPISFIP